MVGMTVGGVIREDMREIEGERENYIGTLGTAMDWTASPQIPMWNR